MSTSLLYHVFGIRGYDYVSTAYEVQVPRRDRLGAVGHAVRHMRRVRRRQSLDVAAGIVGADKLGLHARRYGSKWLAFASG
jgi:hypothetical protein